jgi:hypothetical protein
MRDPARTLRSDLLHQLLPHRTPETLASLETVLTWWAVEDSNL